AKATQTRLIPKELHEQLQQHSILTEANGRSPPRARSVSSTLKQTTLKMTKAVSDSRAETKARKKNADTESLAAIQEKISKFQPKIDALLPRMLSGTTAAVPSKDTSGTTPRSRGATDAPLSEAIAKVSSGSKSAAVQSKSAAVKPAAGQASALGSLAPKPRKVAAATVPVSIADRIPKGSRTKPIPTIATTAIPPSTTTTKQAGNQPEEAIILLSSLPSFSQDVEDLAISDADVRHLKQEDSDKSDDEPLIDRRRQQPYTTEANATTDTTATVATIKQPALRKDAPILAAKSHSIISIGSSKSDLSASIIPSIDNDMIKNWMGGVKEALGGHHDTLATSNTDKATGTEAETSERVASTLECETTTTTIAHHRNDDSVGKDSKNGGVRILAKNSLPSAPPVPLFHLDHDDKKDITATTAPHSQDPDLADDVSTVLVGGQPTQDSFALQSLPSYYYEKEDNGHLSESQQEEEVDEFYPIQQQQPQGRRSPSLPSGLTASCLQELGLEKKRRSSGQGSRSVYQKRRSGAGSSLEEEECAYETMILAQGDMFPSSIGEAPVSSLLPNSASLSSFDLPDPPRYTYALPDRAAQSQQDDDGWDLQQEQELKPEVDDDDTQEYPKPIEIQDSFSFPLPPSQTSFTVTLPTMPTFPSTIRSEPSLIILGSQPPETQEYEE
ncbi:hypothetical protein BGZ72_003933, partial [Mortierella alpina]